MKNKFETTEGTESTETTREDGFDTGNTFETTERRRVGVEEAEREAEEGHALSSSGPNIEKNTTTERKEVGVDDVFEGIEEEIEEDPILSLPAKKTKIAMLGQLAGELRDFVPYKKRSIIAFAAIALFAPAGVGFLLAPAATKAYHMGYGNTLVNGISQRLLGNTVAKIKEDFKVGMASHRQEINDTNGEKDGHDLVNEGVGE